MVDWLAQLLCIQEVLCLSLVPEISYPEVFRGFPQSHQANARIAAQNYATTAAFQTLSNSSFTYHPFILCSIAVVAKTFNPDLPVDRGQLFGRSWSFFQNCLFKS
jgi:hypothetical protein